MNAEKKRESERRERACVCYLRRPDALAEAGPAEHQIFLRTPTTPCDSEMV